MLNGVGHACGLDVCEPVARRKCVTAVEDAHGDSGV